MDRPGTVQTLRLLLLFSLALLALYEFLASPFFRVRDIQVEGCRSLSPTLVIQESGIVLGENIWRIDVERAARSIESNPWVESARVSRRLPGVITITIQERDPLAAVAYRNVYLVVARDGLVLAVVQDVSGLGLPVLDGFAVDSSWELNQVRGQDILNALDALAMLDKEWRSFVARLALGQDGALELYTVAGYPVDLGPPDRELPAKFQALAAVWTDLRARGVAGSVAGINLQTGTRPTVRFKSAGGG